MSVEKLQEQLAAVKTSEDMPGKELCQASKKMNDIIREELAKARDEGNTNQFASLLAEYRKIWHNKPGFVLRSADLHFADLRFADLHGADLSLTHLGLAFLHEANLSEADLHGADLHGAFLVGADLHGADLRGADLHGADLHGADLHNVITIGADFTKVKNSPKLMTKDELQAKLADAIKTPDELLNAIQRFLEGSNKNSITKQKLDTLPSLYKAALDIGNNGAKNRKDGSVICQQSDTICKKLLSSAHSLNEKFPVLTATPFSRLHVKMADALKGRGGEDNNFMAAVHSLNKKFPALAATPFSRLHIKMADALKGRGGEGSNFMAAVTFLRGIFANQKDSSLSGLTPDIGVKIVSVLLSNGKESDECLATQMAYQLRVQADKKEFSAKEVIRLKHVLSHNEQALPSVKAILKLEERIIEAVSTAKDGEKIIIKTTVDGRKHSSDTVREALKEASGKQNLPDTVALTRKYKTSEKSKKRDHDNHIQITMPKEMVAAICPSKKKEEKTLASSTAPLSPSVLEMQMTSEPPVLGSVVEQTRG